MKFQALVVRETLPASGALPVFVQKVEERDTAELPDGELLIRVRYSSLNYKDALSARGNRGVTRSFPHTPGIDAAGEIAESTSTSFREGDEVIVTGFDLGMNTSGGFGEYIRVPAVWALPLPSGLSARTSMVYGTAGLTAAIAVDRLASAGVTPRPKRQTDGRPVLVTGAKGGVGSFSVALLSQMGFEVEAVTGSPAAEEYLRRLGAADVVARAVLEAEDTKPLLHARWAAAVDTVGGPILSNLLRAIDYGGAVAACGNAASASFEGSVLPFILRGVSLLGIDSARHPMDRRALLWRRLSEAWAGIGDKVRIEECGLDELPGRIAAMSGSKIVGRVVVAHSR